MFFTITEQLDAPRAAVFDVVSDPRRRIEWQSSLASVHLEREGPPGLGTRWYELTRGGLRFDLEISEHERPLRWAERARGRWADAQLRVELSEGPRPSATELVLSVEIQFHGLARWAAPAVRALMPIALRADLRRLAQLARAAGPGS